MEKKDIRRLVRDFEEKYPKHLTAESYFTDFVHLCYNPEKDIDFQIFVICAELCYCSAGWHGIYLAFRSGDMELLNNSVYQRACEEHLSLSVHSGYDHSHCYGRVVPYIMAANLFERVPLLFPKHLGMSRNGYRPYVIAANLFMALYYKDSSLAEQARREAIAKLDTKMNRFDRANILYLLSLSDGKPEEASLYLKDICEGIKRLNTYTSELDKDFCLIAHGLYNFARYLGIDTIEIPDASNFSKEFACHQLSVGSKRGKLFFHYPEPLAITNIILSVAPPEVQLYHPYPDINTSLKHLRDIDSTKFVEQLREKVKKKAGVTSEQV